MKDYKNPYPALSKREGQVYDLKEKRNKTLLQIQDILGIGRSVENYYTRAKRKIAAMRVTLKNIDEL